MELLTHGDEHHEIGDGGWLMMMTTTNPPLPLARPPTSWAPWMPSDVNSNPIYLLSERKNSRRRNHRVLRYEAAAKP